MDVSQYLVLFLEEAREHLQSLNQCLLELENDPTDLSVLDEIFRSAHTIKGMSATMGYTDIAELTHNMENILDLLRKDQLKANHVIIDILFQCVDTLERLVEDVANNENSETDVKGLIQQLSALTQEPNAETTIVTKEQEKQIPEQEEKIPEQAQPPLISAFNETNLTDTEVTMITSAQKQGISTFEIQVILREDCLLKSARAYMVMNIAEELGDVIKTVPGTEDLENGNFDQQFQIILLTSANQEKVREEILSISEIEMVSVLPCVISGNLIGGNATEPDAVQNNAVAISNQEELTAPETKVDMAPVRVNTATHEKRLKGGQSVRVDIDKLDSLLNLVGELVINKTRLEQIGISHRLADLSETIEQIDRVTTDLQSVVMKVRMVPVGQVFNRFPRMVRDLSHELGKEINLIIQGEETELDRTVIDEIGDPLVHLLRNAVDHGIERIEDRQAAGKGPVGEIRLIARHEGNNVVILVEDDGKGINAVSLKEKALQKGFVTRADADKMDEKELLNLLFLPGFSTAATVTDISGRGVGMDAVKTKIESLGGAVEIETKVGSGSKFKIRLPLTLAIIQALLVQVSQEIYAIPLSSIDSTIHLRPEDIKTVQNQEVILLRGQIIPIVRLSTVLNIPADRKEQSDLFIVIVHSGQQRAGIIVDDLIGQQEIVIKSLGNLLKGIKVIAGATILGNGQVALILDVSSLMK
ncbi:MAG: cheA2 [Firmicutes bacterium]|nr:cheA2 [Bacillota bacterium]